MLIVKETLKVLQLIRKKDVKKHKDQAQGFCASFWAVVLCAVKYFGSSVEIYR